MPEKILLTGSEVSLYEEAKAAEAGIYPGHLLQYVTDKNQVKRHAVYGGPANGRMVAIEDVLQGNDQDTVYTNGQRVCFYHVAPGARFQGVVKDGESLSVFDTVQSDGAGRFVGAPVYGDELLYSNVAASAEVENTTAETAFDKSYTIPANMLQAGDLLKIRAVVFVLDQNSTDTLTLKLKLGSTVLLTSIATDVADNDVGILEANVLIRTIGTSGTYIAWGDSYLDAEAAAVTAAGLRYDFTPSTAINTTTTNAITVTGTWSVAHADNECYLDALTVELERTMFPVAQLLEAAAPSGADGLYTMMML